MTKNNEQIIIDGVDVSGCEFLIINKDKQMCRCIKSDLFGGIEFVENAKNGNCKDNPNCYYKQLKRKEQECEELKEILNEGCLHNLTLMTEQRVLLQTLAEIKKLVEKEFCTQIECCEFCANSNDCLNRKIIEKINEVEDGI